uniref:Protein kinase domain-containing protein n=1 Tax=Oryza brachyantha TaxID=4533 RepID=J3MPZ8_ORYBR
MAGCSLITSATVCSAGLIFFSVCYLAPAPVAALSFNYTNFTRGDENAIKREGQASIDASAGLIDVTANRITGIGGSVGRAYNAQPMLLWDKDSGEVASFTTRFSFVIQPVQQEGGINNKGAGMAFFLAAYPFPDAARSGSYNLGLTDQSVDTIAAGDGRFVAGGGGAVEFDTFNNTEVKDPDDTYDHLGIDINSVISSTNVSLPNFSLTGNMTAVIKYDNVTSILAMALQLDDSRNMNYSLSYKVDLKSVLPEKVCVGFSASTTTSVELHQVRSWYFSSSMEPKTAPSPPPVVPPPSMPVTAPTTSGSVRGGVVAGATVGAALFAVLLFATAAVFVRRRLSKRRREEAEEAENRGSDDDDEPIVEIEMGTGPRRFPYHDVVEATKSFAAEEKLGQGGFGSVYRGYLREQGLAVAIKRFAKDSSKQGRKEYKSEIKVISQLRHRNLVQLIGWCHGHGELLLIYELFPNRSLDIHLHGNGTFLTWPMRVKIVLGIGSALVYLHEEGEKCVVHRDIKPSNVMLDESFGAKLGDFGLARFIDHAAGMQTMTAVSGTPGYVDPQCIITGRASAESDVYSFGIVVLEVACGKRPMSLIDSDNLRLVEWAWDMYGKGEVLAVADERLDGMYDAAELERVVAVGLWCAHPDPAMRPPIKDAMAMLQSGGQLPALPAKMPVPMYTSPAISVEGLFASSVGLSSSSATQSSSTASG